MEFSVVACINIPEMEASQLDIFDKKLVAFIHRLEHCISQKIMENFFRKIGISLYKHE